MTRDLSRLLRPKSLAVVGGGAWAKLVIEQCHKIGFTGPIWPVHPKAETVAGLAAYRTIEDLPAPPDACFVGVNRFATVEVVSSLAKRKAGGAVCFASGFLEAKSEDPQAADLQADLLAAAGDMPILGPNCYGFINYLDGALLWPDQHGGVVVDKGVALVTQSSNMAISLTMQNRGLPIAYVVTAGNQAQSGIAEIGTAVLDDPRVTALGLHIEGFGDIPAFEALASHARALGKPIIALKVGKSEQAQAATVSHTASLAGGEAGAAALLERLGIARVNDLSSFLESLKLLHVTGGLPMSSLATISCSGGEASLAADIGHSLGLDFPPLNNSQRDNLREALGPMVALANPLDYHTYIWRDTPAMIKAFSAMVDPALAITMLIVDFPRSDRCDPIDWQCTIDAAIAVRAQTGSNIAMVSTLPELMPEHVSRRLLDAGVIPFCGLTEALTAVSVAAQSKLVSAPPIAIPPPLGDGHTKLIAEAKAKQDLSEYGLRIPKSCRATNAQDAAHKAQNIGFPVVLKGEGVAHKTEAGAVVLNLASAQAVNDAAKKMPCDSFLVEQMVQGTIAELLIGVVRDPAHGFVMTLAAGGTLTEILDDSASLLLPATDEMIENALDSLRIAPILAGYRGMPAVDRSALIAAIRSVQGYVLANSDGLVELEINPLLCSAHSAIAADALIRRKD